MLNDYKIIKNSALGLPYVEVYGRLFHYQDLYEFVGKNEFLTTFVLKKNSSAYQEFGRSILGVIFYSPNELDKLENSLVSGSGLEKNTIRIDCPSDEVSAEKRRELKYQGIGVQDIESISFFPYKRAVERHNTGEKKIPNLVHVKTDLSKLNLEVLEQNYLVKKHNNDVELVQFEKERLIALILGFNDGRIDKQILSEFGYTEDELITNINIRNHYYKIRTKRGQITEEEAISYRNTKQIYLIRRMKVVLKELIESGLKNKLQGSEEQMKNISESIESFSPSILMHGKKQIYWDFESYVHIAMRHLRDYQVGEFREKSPFPYQAEDLKRLIENVLDKVEEEIEQHWLTKPKQEFYRHGRMAIRFNGDFYHLRINAEGKLVQFHIKSHFTK